MKKISIIIATYNRWESLLITLGSVATQDLPPEQWECVVVNNNSTDRTQQAAEEFAAAHPHLDFKVLFESRQGLSWARNCGIEGSCGEIVAIIDDDEIINEEFASSYLKLFEDYPQATSAGGVIIPRYTSGRPKWMSHYTELPIANPLFLGSNPREFPKGKIPGGGNMAIRRTALQRYGTFDVELGRTAGKLIGGEESDLFERLSRGGEQCWYCPTAIMWHIIPPEKLTLEYFDNLTYNIGVSQRLRAQISGRGFAVAEIAKWCATLPLALLYLVQLNGPKSLRLLRLRWNISRGLFATQRPVEQ
ncbi:MAG: glycosyltransferase family 2 protein [Rikenellaceae bacterium]